MMSVRVVLVEPRYEGNVGAVCRVMKNFGFSELFLVKPCELGDFAKAMSMHARDVLESARIVDTFEEALEGVDIAIATTGKPGARLAGHVRHPYFNPKELREMLEDKAGTAALVFGREDRGLTNDMLERCDIVAYIPTSKEYPIMNLSQAVAIFMYELSGFKGGRVALASRELMDVFYSHYERLLDDIGYPEHKKGKTMTMLRRIYGRAMLNEREYYTIMGVLHEIELALERARKHG
ncbi:RNA methyltransferase [Methanocella conradii]|uniref:RNA methyltransferase n=1 Tax=Methanocella conradii TaxID=1175444 RepID=UPI00157DD61F|nr:RNA methyltransferase [Methanocella conradii]